MRITWSVIRTITNVHLYGMNGAIVYATLRNPMYRYINMPYTRNNFKTSDRTLAKGINENSYAGDQVLRQCRPLTIARSLLPVNISFIVIIVGVVIVAFVVVGFFSHRQISHLSFFSLDSSLCYRLVIIMRESKMNEEWNNK